MGRAVASAEATDKRARPRSTIARGPASTTSRPRTAARCDACVPPAGGTATCNGTACDFTCGTMKKCATKCTSGCCVDTDCGMQAGMAGKCDTSTNVCNYTCAAGFKPCGAGNCIPMANCCSQSDCPGTCKTCSAAGACVTVMGADDLDSCNGTCDATGACKSKRGQTCLTGSGCIAGTTCAPDGYCCNTACTNSCEACDIAGFLGTCTPVAPGAPRSGHPACSGTGPCAGSCGGQASTCVYPGSGTSCRAASCMTGTATLAAGCNGAGSCPAVATAMCNPFICGTTACLATCTSNSQCVTGAACVNGVCTPCGTGQTVCPNACANLQTDPVHCGSCTAAPCSGTCQAGLCCTGATTNCNGTCVDLTSDDNHCGACSGSTASCVGGGVFRHCRNSQCRAVDGSLCSSDSECFSGKCNIFYHDFDHDGYPDQRVTQGFCTLPLTTDYILPRSDIAWDCCDEITKVHPGSTEFFPWGPSSVFFNQECQSSAGDTNCDGTIEVDPALTGLVVDTCQLSGSLCEPVYKVFTPADCGVGQCGNSGCDGTCQPACFPGPLPFGVGCR